MEAAISSSLSHPNIVQVSSTQSSKEQVVEGRPAMHAAGSRCRVVQVVYII